MNTQEFQNYVAQLKLPELGIRYLDRVRVGGPSRRVQSGAGNVIVRFPSAKMGAVRQAESRTVELPMVVLLEHDPLVIEYYDQPEPINLRYKAKSGRITGVRHTFDYLSLNQSGVYMIECKEQEKLEQLAETMPNRFKKTVEGHWISPPGQEAASQFGFLYRVVSSAQLNPVLTRNLYFLSDYLWKDCQNPDDRVRQLVGKAVQTDPGITIKALLDATPSLRVEQLPACGCLASRRLRIMDRDASSLIL